VLIFRFFDKTFHTERMIKPVVHWGGVICRWSFEFNINAFILCKIGKSFRYRSVTTNQPPYTTVISRLSWIFKFNITLNIEMCLLCESCVLPWKRYQHFWSPVEELHVYIHSIYISLMTTLKYSNMKENTSCIQ